MEKVYGERKTEAGDHGVNCRVGIPASGHKDFILLPLTRRESDTIAASMAEGFDHVGNFYLYWYKNCFSFYLAAQVRIHQDAMSPRPHEFPRPISRLKTGFYQHGLVTITTGLYIALYLVFLH